MMELLNEFLSGSVAWGVLLTLAAFALGALVNRVTGKAFFNPLLLGAIFVIVFLSVCGIPYADYKVSAAPVNYLLLPATVALAIPLYEKLDLLKANAAAIIAGISVGTLVRHLGPCRGHQQGPADGRGGRCYERPVHRRGRCADRSALPGVRKPY